MLGGCDQNRSGTRAPLLFLPEKRCLPLKSFDRGRESVRARQHRDVGVHSVARDLIETNRMSIGWRTCRRLIGRKTQSTANGGRRRLRETQRLSKTAAVVHESPRRERSRPLGEETAYVKRPTRQRRQRR